MLVSQVGASVEELPPRALIYNYTPGRAKLDGSAIDLLVANE